MMLMTLNKNAYFVKHKWFHFYSEQKMRSLLPRLSGRNVRGTAVYNAALRAVKRSYSL
jgi:hypothetical protein